MALVSKNPLGGFDISGRDLTPCATILGYQEYFHHLSSNYRELQHKMRGIPGEHLMAAPPVKKGLLPCRDLESAVERLAYYGYKYEWGEGTVEDKAYFSHKSVKY